MILVASQKSNKDIKNINKELDRMGRLEGLGFGEG